MQATTSIGVNRSTTGYTRMLVALAVLSVAGAATFFYLLSQDPGRETWGLFTVNFIFLLGLTQFGVVFSAIMRICHARWSRPFHRLAELVTVGFLPFAFVGLLFIYLEGRHDLFYWLDHGHDAGGHLSPWLNERWLLIRNLAAQAIFYAVAVIYFIAALRPDLDESLAREGPAWRRALYRWLPTAADDTQTRLQAHSQRLYVLSVIVLVAFVPANTFIAWDFGMMLYEHYHSSVFPMYSIMSNLFVGTAALVLLQVMMSRYVATDEYFGVRQVQSMGVLLTGFALLWLYFFWAQFFVTWFGNLPHEMAPIWKRMYGHYAPFFWTMMICVVGIPVASLIFQKIKKTLWTMELLTVVMIIGIWLNRYLMVMPAIRDDHTVFTSFAEVVITAGWFASYLFVLLLLFNVFPVISRWESDPVRELGTAYKTYTMK